MSMKKELKSDSIEEKTLFQLTNMASSLDDINKCMRETIDKLGKVIEGDNVVITEDNTPTLMDKIETSVYLSLFVILILVVWFKL